MPPVVLVGLLLIELQTSNCCSTTSLDLLLNSSGNPNSLIHVSVYTHLHVWICFLHSCFVGIYFFKKKLRHVPKVQPMYRAAGNVDRMLYTNPLNSLYREIVLEHLMLKPAWSSG